MATPSVMHYTTCKTACMHWLADLFTSGIRSSFCFCHYILAGYLLNTLVLSILVLHVYSSLNRGESLLLWNIFIIRIEEYKNQKKTKYISIFKFYCEYCSLLFVPQPNLLLTNPIIIIRKCLMTVLCVCPLT